MSASINDLEEKFIFCPKISVTAGPYNFFPKENVLLKILKYSWMSVFINELEDQFEIPGKIF